MAGDVIAFGQEQGQLIQSNIPVVVDEALNGFKQWLMGKEEEIEIS